MVPIGPATPAKIVVAEFRVHYDGLTKDRYGDYVLKLGLAKDDKDEAWKLSDYDGMMMDVVFRVTPRLNPLAIADAEVVDSPAAEWNLE